MTKAPIAKTKGATAGSGSARALPLDRCLGAIAMPGADWEEHDEQSVWVEIDDD